MPYLNNRQFLDAGFAGPEWVGKPEAQDPRPPGVRYPQTQQLSLPGLGDGPEQMRLFDTQRAGPANVYTANPSRDAGDWRDQDLSVPLGEDQQAIVDDEEYEVQGQFFEFPVGLEDREHIAYGGAHQQTLQSAKDAGTYLGHDEYPGQTNPSLQFRDLQQEGDGWGEAEWWTPGGSMVGKVGFHEDEWGPQVDHAEINPLYRGRGFSREAIPDFAGSLEPGQGIVHAGSYTDAGAGAFHKKGIPTEGDIESGYYDWVDGLEPDEEEVLWQAEDRYPEEDWRSPDAPQGYLDEIRNDLRNTMRDDPDNRMMFRENLETMQEQVLENLPGRRSAFRQGWTPKGPTRGFNEELPGMPSKYTGGR